MSISKVLLLELNAVISLSDKLLWMNNATSIGQAITKSNLKPRYVFVSGDELRLTFFAIHLFYHVG